MPDHTSPEEKERAAAMDADILDLRRAGMQFDEIGRLMVDKYPRTSRSSGSAVDDLDQPYSKQYMHQRWLTAVRAVPVRKVEDLRTELNERLEGFLVQVESVLTKDHYAHSNGRVVVLDGQPLLDDGPKLAAIAEGRKLLAEIRVLNGATVPVDQNLNLGGHLSININGVDLETMK
jgi:hypothetical protein